MSTIFTSGSTRRMTSHNGTIGLAVSRVNNFDYEWERDSVLVMNSDGLNSRWKIENYPGVTTKHPAILAGLLFRDHKRGTDDVTILVARDS